jgi:hypothetical protein
MESMSLRQIDIDHDLPALAELLNKVRIQQVTAERLLEWERTVPSSSPLPGSGRRGKFGYKPQVGEFRLIRRL